MRVLFAITRGEVGGAQEHLRVLAKGLLARGHHVGLAVEAGGDLAQNLASEGGTVFEWRSITRNPHPLRDARARRELRRMIDAFRPDVLALYSSKAGVLGRRLLPLADGVTIFTCHHAPFGPGRQWSHRLLARPVEQLTLRFVDGIISDGARDIPLLRRVAPHVPIRLIPNGTSASPPVTSPRVTNTALWVARFRRPKDPLQAIEAWRHLHRTDPRADLLLCGDGPLLPAARDRVRRLPDPSRVQLLGHVPSVAPFHQQASVFVLTSSVEGGVTMATLEAMAAGLVPVISDVGDAFLLEHAGCGVVVPRNSPKTVAEAVHDLLSNPARLESMGKAAIGFSRETWTAERLVESTISFYRDLLGAR